MWWIIMCTFESDLEIHVMFNFCSIFVNTSTVGFFHRDLKQDFIAVEVLKIMLKKLKIIMMKMKY